MSPIRIYTNIVFSLKYKIQCAPEIFVHHNKRLTVSMHKSSGAHCRFKYIYNKKHIDNIYIFS